MSIPDLVRNRLTRERRSTSVTLRMPVDVIESLKSIAPLRGFSGYQALLKAYVADGLRRDEATYLLGGNAALLEALRRRGVAPELLEDAVREAAEATARPDAAAA